MSLLELDHGKKETIHKNLLTQGGLTAAFFLAFFAAFAGLLHLAASTAAHLAAGASLFNFSHSIKPKK